MERIRVATLNIWNKSGPWKRRLDLIRRELGQLSPDVLGLQEVLRLRADDGDEGNQAADIADGFDYERVYGRASDFGEGLEFGNAVLSRFPIVESRCVALPGAESGETRSMLYALLDSPAGRLPVFVTHLNWKLHHGSVRVEQVRFIAEKVKEIAPTRGPNLPPVLMGDFNAEPESDEIRYLRGLATLDAQSVYFADAWIHGGDGSPGYTFDRENRFAALAHEPPRRIDYIFVRGPDWKFRGEPMNTRLAFHRAEASGEGPVWPSDHYGVVTEVYVAPRSE